MGCYVDGTAGRLLKNAVSLSAFGGGSNATIGNCMSACQAKGYAYCGEEYYSECYGSNTAPDVSLIAAGADPLKAGCNFPCKGNASEVSSDMLVSIKFRVGLLANCDQACGGSNGILVYVNNGTAA